MQIEKAESYRAKVIALLANEKLPTDDLPQTLENFVVAKEGEEVTGIAGIELYESYGLLRSVAVSAAYRGKGIANQLLDEVEKLAAAKSLRAIYLLTETAPEYFGKKGYEKITRAEVPAEVRQSTEFSHVCPQSAIVMKKNIIKSMKNILVLCTGNSCRSQLAEGYLRFFAGDKANIYSAGIETHGVNPKAIQVMAEDHIDISNHTSNHVDEYTNIPFDYVITVCDNANEACPFFPGNVQRFHHNFPDPAKAKGTPEEVLNEFRSVRDIIKAYAANFVKQHVA